MVVALVRSQNRLLSFSSILHYLPQASVLQPRSNDGGRRKFVSETNFNERYKKRRRMNYSVMHTGQLHSASNTDESNRANFEVKRNTRFISESRADDFVFRLVSYNLLAQHQLEKNSYLYEHCTEEVIQWDRRRRFLCEEMKSFAADVMCLQEVQTDHYIESLKPFFESLGFESYFKMKTRNGHDGVAIVYRRSRFELLEVELVEFHRKGHSVLRADNVGILILLQPVTSSEARYPPICVATTHLYFNANRGDVKLAQLTLLLAHIERMAKRKSPQYGYNPILLCGDFNSEPTSPLFRFLTSGRLSNFLSLKRSAVSDQNLSAFWGEPSNKLLTSTDLPPPEVDWNCCFTKAKSEEPNELVEGDVQNHDDITHPFFFTSVIPPPETADRANRCVTSFTAHDMCCVDHMFYTQTGLRLVKFSDAVMQSEFTRVAGIPNYVHASDHIPLLADFVIRTEDEIRGGDVTQEKPIHRL